MFGGCTAATEGDLIGVWEITDFSRKLLPDQMRQAAGQLTLAADGTFEASALPVSIGLNSYPWPAAGPEVSLLTGSGHWKLGRAGSQAVVLSIKSAQDGYAGRVPYSDILSVYADIRGYSLVDYWGDPDAAPGIYYKRR